MLGSLDAWFRNDRRGLWPADFSNSFSIVETQYIASLFSFLTRRRNILRLYIKTPKAKNASRLILILLI